MRDQVCLICLGDILGMSPKKLRVDDIESPLAKTGKQSIVKLACSNKANTLYHKNCLSEWLKIKAECPLCRNVDILITHVLTSHTNTDISSISGVTRVSTNRTALNS